MKALSVRQPWAGLIASGKKRIELRTWTVSYRGPLLICAGVSLYKGKGKDDYPEDEWPRGVAICIVDLVDIRAPRDRDERFTGSGNAPSGRELCWVLERPRLVSPFPVRGKLSIFEVEDRLIRVQS